MMRQEIDGLTEQVRLMNESLDYRHQELLARLDQLTDALEEQSRKEVSQEDIEDIKEIVDSTQSDISDLADVVKNIDEHLIQE